MGRPSMHHHLVHGDDPGMPELGDDPGLGVEPLDVLAALDQVGLGDLEGDRPVQLDVEGAPDGAERPLADLLQELELAQPPLERSSAGRCPSRDRPGLLGAAISSGADGRRGPGRG